ncbi:3316_t:CDS:2 [Scutellospora calospora]|uniref:3316_t:CDS:1 n=1 Tax=Scutellospora calospora TaxID=85575 RepID=A0ACA9K9H6_9GLOM|nr:3316_t:CDS:2 [Scutellospora calospora]
MNDDKITRVWTDGSFFDRGIKRSGIGVFFSDNDPRNLSERLHEDHNDNNRAEICAVIRALEICEDIKNLEIITDSGWYYSLESNLRKKYGYESEYIFFNEKKVFKKIREDEYEIEYLKEGETMVFLSSWIFDPPLIIMQDNKIIINQHCDLFFNMICFHHFDDEKSYEYWKKITEVFIKDCEEK